MKKKCIYAYFFSFFLHSCASLERMPRYWAKSCLIVMLKLPYCQYWNNYIISHGAAYYMPYRRAWLISGVALAMLHCILIALRQEIVRKSCRKLWGWNPCPSEGLKDVYVWSDKDPKLEYSYLWMCCKSKGGYDIIQLEKIVTMSFIGLFAWCWKFKKNHQSMSQFDQKNDQQFMKNLKKKWKIKNQI